MPLERCQPDQTARTAAHRPRCTPAVSLQCPRTVENFTTHAKNGYYDGIIFHR